MKILTICNRKGGVGKTTTAFNLGYALALDKKRVLFVDLDSQCNLSLLCNKEPLTLEAWKACDIQHMNAFIDILPGTKRFAMLENEINMLIDRNAYLKDSVLPCIANYDYMIIDTPPALSILNINAFIISDMVLIMVNPDYFSLSGLKEMKDILEQIKSINKNLTYRIVLNAFFSGRKFTENVKDVLLKESSFTGIEIPHRQHIIDSSALKKPAIDIEEILQPFKALTGVING